MAAETLFYAPCPHCDGERNCRVLGEKEIEGSFEDDHNFQSWGSAYKMLQCCGCETVFFYKNSWHSEDVSHSYDAQGQTVSIPNYTTITFPEPTKKNIKAEWTGNIASVDIQLFTLMEEMYKAYENKSFILASIGLRTIFERTAEILDIHPRLNLAQKVEKLMEEGHIGETEKDLLLIVTNAGNAAAHRSWSPKESEFKALLAIIEDFTRRSLLRDKSVNGLRDSIPRRDKRHNPPTPVGE